MTNNWKQLRLRIFAATVILVMSASARAQIAKPDSAAPESITLHLGDKAVLIPTPAGFEEAASQFPSVRLAFSATEAQGNDMLAIHLLKSDCDRLRRGGTGAYSFYTKISIFNANREREYSAAEFAAISVEFRKNGAALLDLNSPRLKAAVERAETAINQSGDPKVSLGQPVSLGEFDNRTNVYSVMLMMDLTVDNGAKRQIVPVLATVTYLRVKQRMFYVYTYRKYESKADVEVLRDFARRWVDSIIAAN